MSEATEKKAREYLADGKVSVRAVDLEAATALVHVSGSKPGEPYHVAVRGSTVVCDCPARIHDCAHALAAALVVPVAELEAPATRVPFVGAADLEGFLAGLG